MCTHAEEGGMEDAGVLAAAGAIKQREFRHGHECLHMIYTRIHTHAHQAT